MKIQAIRFQQWNGSNWEFGVAKLKNFDVSDIDWIVDSNGQIVPEVWDYKLMGGPLAYMELEAHNE